ncbi:MAG: hypothetical protein GY759_10865, partial [Chloroflexi bacterium]|nr:hypothetical protein [Chloroflexota bacterium]
MRSANRLSPCKAKRHGIRVSRITLFILTLLLAPQSFTVRGQSGETALPFSETILTQNRENRKTIGQSFISSEIGVDDTEHLKKMSSEDPHTNHFEADLCPIRVGWSGAAENQPQEWTIYVECNMERDSNANAVTPLDVPPAPLLLNPTDNSTLNTLIPVMRIDARLSGVQISPRIDISTDPTFQSINQWTTYCGWSDEYYEKWPLWNLQPNTHYYWRARSVYGNACSDPEPEWGPSSAVWSFYLTSAGTVIPGPSLLSPPNGSIVNNQRPGLSWQSLHGRLGFEVWGRDITLNRLHLFIMDWNITANDFAFPWDLEIGHEFEWWVQIRNNYAWGEESPHWRFSVLTPPSTVRIPVIRASISTSADQSNDSALWPIISGDGRFVAFTSWADTLIADDNNERGDIFVHDLITRQTERISVASDGSQSDGNSKYASISGDGRFVTFGSEATNLVPGDTNGASDVFVHDRATGQTTRVSISSNASEANGSSYLPTISDDGRFVAFESAASNIVAEDTNGVNDVFVHDLQENATKLVSRGRSGLVANGPSGFPSVSADGQLIAFESGADDIITYDTNQNWDIFVLDQLSGNVQLVSKSTSGIQGNRTSWEPKLSADGNHVVFRSWSTNIVAGDYNSFEDIFIHDLASNSTELVSVANGGTQTNQPSWGPSISADGRYVAFTSRADNLVEYDPNVWCDINPDGVKDNCADVFLRDLLTKTTKKISDAFDGRPANNEALSSSLSHNGQIIAYDSFADNLVPNDTNGYLDIFVRFFGDDYDRFISDPDQSTVQVSKVLILADGIDTAEISIKILDNNRIPLSGKRLKINSERSSDILAQSVVVTDVSGKATTTIRSVETGSTLIRVWNLTDGFQLPQSISVTFMEPTEPSIYTTGQHIVNIGNSVLDTNADLAWKVKEESVYFRNAMITQSLQLAATIVGGLFDAVEVASDVNQVGSASSQVFSGWKQWLDSPAFADESICKLGNAFMEDVTGEDEVLKFTLRAGILYLAAQHNNECLSQIGVDLISDTLLLESLLENYLESPTNDWDLTTLSEDAKQSLTVALDALLQADLSSLSVDQIAKRMQSLTMRASAVNAMKWRIQYALWTLQAIHQANESDPYGGQTLQMALRLGASGIATLAFDGTGKALVGASFTIFDTYMDSKALEETAQMYVFANMTLLKTAPEIAGSTANDLATGLLSVAKPYDVQIPSGSINVLSHVVEASGLGPFAVPHRAYSEVFIRNTGDIPATFHVWANYEARTTRLSVPWATLSLVSEAVPVDLAPGAVATTKIVYLDGDHGYLPADEYNPLGIVDIPPTNINFELVAMTEDDGMFYADHDSSRWEPESIHQASSAGLGSSTLSTEIIDRPLTSFVWPASKLHHYEALLGVNNPLNEFVKITLMQPLSNELQIIDSGGGQFSDNLLVWETVIQPYGHANIKYSFVAVDNINTQISMPGATITFQSKAYGDLTTTSPEAEIPLWLPLQVSRQTPPRVMLGGGDAVKVSITNDMDTIFAGSIALNFVSSISDVTVEVQQSITLEGNSTIDIQFQVPVELTAGRYSVQGFIHAYNRQFQIFSDPLSIRKPDLDVFLPIISRSLRETQKNKPPKNQGGRGRIRTNHFSKPGKRSKRFSNSSIAFLVNFTPV